MTKLSSDAPRAAARPRRATGTGRPRLADVAEHAGVAKITASRVLRGLGSVAAPTRARVEKAMRELGYIPNAVASNLASNRTGVIAVIGPGFSSPLIRDLFQGLSEVMRAEGYQIMLGMTGTVRDEEEALIRAFLARRVDALVLTNPRHTAPAWRLLRAAGIPVVEVGELAARPVSMTVGFSNQAASRAVVRHLVSSGRRRIAMISEEHDERNRAHQRQAGYRAALHEAGLDADPALLVEAPLSLAGAASAARRLFAVARLPDAVFCSDDVLALGVLFECMRQGWQVPRQLAIAGFGDLDIAAEAITPLTSLRVERVEMGRRAGAMLLAALRGDALAERHHDMGFAVIARASTGS